MDPAAIETAADILVTARLRATPVVALPEGATPATVADGYAIQARVAARLEAAGLGPVVGHKIGCTTRVMQQYLEITDPCAGALFAGMVREGVGEFDRHSLCRPGVECEIAVRLGRDLGGDGPVTVAEAAAAVDCAMASIELVDDRWADFRTVRTPSLVAEHFFNAGCVLGPPVSVSPDTLKSLAGEMRICAESVGAGTGDDILGDPLEALAWLATHGRAIGNPLEAGDIVTLGSLLKTVWIEPGEDVEIEIERLGRASLRIV